MHLPTFFENRAKGKVMKKSSSGLYVIFLLLLVGYLASHNLLLPAIVLLALFVGRNKK
jgi:hypothetical protein